jgi:hypothetical protein
MRIVTGGEPARWLGANFWSRTGGPLMWRNYDPAVVRAELRVLREHGLTMTRSFFFWPDFMPDPARTRRAVRRASQPRRRGTDGHAGGRRR